MHGCGALHALQWYVLLRQHYLTRGDSVMPWMGTHPHLCNTLAASSGTDAKLLSEGLDQEQQQEEASLEWTEQRLLEQGQAELEAPGQQQMWSGSAALAEELLATATVSQSRSSRTLV
jgi:hypothetical protein